MSEKVDKILKRERKEIQKAKCDNLPSVWT